LGIFQKDRKGALATIIIIFKMCDNYVFEIFCSQGTAPEEAHMISAFGGPG
jgi:hypothetical protein